MPLFPAQLYQNQYNPNMVDHVPTFDNIVLGGDYSEFDVTGGTGTSWRSHAGAPAVPNGRIAGAWHLVRVTGTGLVSDWHIINGDDLLDGSAYTIGTDTPTANTDLQVRFGASAVYLALGVANVILSAPAGLGATTRLYMRRFI